MVGILVNEWYLIVIYISFLFLESSIYLWMNEKTHSIEEIAKKLSQILRQKNPTYQMLDSFDHFSLSLDLLIQTHN